ncbi:85/88 kDa calcium-independent phospholipase A2 [Folsomia candida]|nr:85/88 kDa calcium-independent phospholipase A2 [Folsomia candida]
MVTATRVSCGIPDLHIFRSYSPNGGSNSDFIWSAAKLTGAAPYYFRMEHADLVDGGLLANNPSLDALSELSKIRKSSLHTEIWGKNPKMFVSLGTGFKADVDYTAAYLNLSSKSIASSTKSLSTLTNTIKFFMELTTASNGPLISRAKSWCDDLGTEYFRFNPPLLREYEIDEVDDSLLVDLLFETRIYMIGQQKEIERLYNLVLN